MRVVILKLISGEELIATMEETAPMGAFQKVRAFILNKTGAELIPWVLTNPDAIIEFKPVALACEPIDAPIEIERQYIQATSSIQLMG